MKLYYTPASCSMAAHIVINELNLELSMERVDLKTHQTEKGEDFYKINPKGFVPTLEIKKDIVLTENLAILSYLAEQDPHQNMIASSGLERARTLEWLGFLNSQLHQAYLPLFHGGLDEEAKEKAYTKINRYLIYIDQYLENISHEFLTGDDFGPADAYLFVLSRWSSYVDHDLMPYKSLSLFVEKVEKRPAVQLTLKQEGLV